MNSKKEAHTEPEHQAHGAKPETKLYVFVCGFFFSAYTASNNILTVVVDCA